MCIYIYIYRGGGRSYFRFPRPYSGKNPRASLRDGSSPVPRRRGGAGYCASTCPSVKIIIIIIIIRRRRRIVTVIVIVRLIMSVIVIMILVTNSNNNNDNNDDNINGIMIIIIMSYGSSHRPCHPSPQTRFDAPPPFLVILRSPRSHPEAPVKAPRPWATKSLFRNELHAHGFPSSESDKGAKHIGESSEGEA